MEYRKTCTKLVQAMLDSTSVDEELLAAENFAEFIDGLDPIDQLPLDESMLAGGLALSPQHAASCVRDYLRTVRFIKGVHAAIRDLLDRFPHKKIRILYAGTGPYGTLLLPLLPLLPADRLEISLLDFHAESLQHLKQFAVKLELNTDQFNWIEGDAIRYEHPESDLHLLITETMFDALTREPQVPITVNLCRFLQNDGVLIPEQIDIRLAASNWSKEPFVNAGYVFRNDLNTAPERQLLGTLFELNKDFAAHLSGSNEAWHSENIALDPANKLQDLILLTSISIYKEFKLDPAESCITNPVCIGSVYGRENLKAISLSYLFRESPQWQISYLP